MLGKIALLTSQSADHLWFAAELQKRYPSLVAVVETAAVCAPFPTSHPFESARHQYALRSTSHLAVRSIAELLPCLSVPSVNTQGVIDFLQQEAVEQLLVLGTGRIGNRLLEAFPGKVWGLHEGDPTQYRGLDSHLWAIYHRDFSALKVTLYALSSMIQKGPVALQAPVSLRPGMLLPELRLASLQVGLGLWEQWLKEPGAVQPLAALGRYYSFMPAVLKDGCERHFHRHTQRHYTLVT